MTKLSCFDVVVSETHTEESVLVSVKATSSLSAQAYGDVLASQMPSQTIDCGDTGLKDTEWYCSEVRPN